MWSHLSVILHNILHHTVASNRYYSRKFWWRFNMAVWWFGTNHWNKQLLILAGHSANFRRAHTSRIRVLVLVEDRQICIVSKKGIHRGACFWGPNTVYHTHIPTLGMKFSLCPNCSSSTVLLMVLNATFHFTQFHRTAQADSGNARQTMHYMRCLRHMSVNWWGINCPVKILSNPLFWR